MRTLEREAVTDISDHWDPYDDEPYPDDDPDDWYDGRDEDPEPDEADYEYDAWRAALEEHCEQVHGGADCDCRPPLRERLRDAWQRARRLLRRRPRYSDEPPF